MAPSSKVLTPAQIAAGVCIRPRCQARLTEVKKCTGFREPRNKDRFYQECSDNRHNESSCDGFYWRNDLSTPTYVLGPNDCQEPACAGVAGSARPNKKNGLCVRGACLGCCQAAAAAAPDGVTCKVSSHKLRARVPSAPSGSTSLAAPATPIRTDYSQPLTPTYYAKLISGGDNNLALSGPGSASSNAQKSRYRVEEQHSIQVLYYTQNDLSPVSFTVFCPDYPHFRPSQDKAMVSVLGLAACEVFAAYSSQLNAWSITSSAQQVNVGRVLRLRSTTVTRCQELDVLPVLKRERSGTQSEGSPSPARRKRTNGDVFTDEGDALAGDHNNSVSNSVRAVSPATSVISINSTQPDESVPHGVQSLQNAPAGPRGWPFLYVLDMAVGFREMVRLQQVNGKSRAEAFPLVFHRAYNSSTYSDNLKIWEKSDKNLKKKLEDLGRISGGEWSVLTKASKSK